MSKHFAELEQTLRDGEVKPDVLRRAIEAAEREAEAPSTFAVASASQRPSLPLTMADEALLVCADETQRECCERLLQRQRARVWAARSGVEALSVAAQMHAVTCLVVAMPKVDEALEAVARVKYTTGNRWLPTCVIADDPSVLERRRALAAGVDIVMAADAPESALQEALDQLFERTHALAPKILLIDDDDALLDVLASTLSATGIRVQTLNDPTQVLDRLESTNPDAIVLDLDMPRLRGTEVCSILRSSARWQAIPIVMLTARSDRQTRLACYRAGCDDFLSKPFDAEELTVRLQARVARARALTRSERDPLSGLTLRRVFSMRLHARLSEARRHDLPLSLCLLDLDHFKDVNDRHGHAAGDEVIATLGRALRARLREEDLASRWGGEEFALALPQTRAIDAAHVANVLLDQFSKNVFVDAIGQSFRATFSAGIASFPEDGETIDQLFSVADARLYDAKRGGRALVSGRPPPPFPIDRDLSE